MTMPALAVVGPDHRITRSTESFRRRYEDAKKLCEQAPEIDNVLTGRADIATATLGDLNIEIEAVTDASGKRQAMLTLPLQDASSSPEEHLGALRDAAEESPAIVWVKDLDGRYLYANPRYESDLGTPAERLLGNTDADLPEVETVDGPRLRYAQDGLKEPLQLEYTVPAVDHRPAMAAFRFPLRDEAGEPIATCGVAAPSGQAEVARDEAVRLMQLERWNRIDPMNVRAEVLEEWRVQAASSRVDELGLDDDESPPEEAPEARHAESTARPPKETTLQLEPDPPAAESEPRVQRERVEETSRPSETAAAPTPAPPPAKALAEPMHSLSETAELLQTNLQLARKWADRAEQLQGELQAAQTRTRDAESETQQALAAAARAAEEADQWRTELEQTRLELEQAQDEARAARSEADVARGELERAQDEARAARSEAEVARGELERAQDEARAARSEAEVARGELGAARAQTEALRGPSTVALRLSEELGRAVASERERSEELERTLARLQSRLNDFETAFERDSSAARSS
jgi:PAS domain-containing protein